MHYGLLPRANRGIFAINELPDLAGKIQVGLFNILQEGDVQIKGYPVRLPLDVMMVFTANPEDYTARGKIITPLKDRIGSEIRTHYPADRSDAMAITAQEAWLTREASAPDVKCRPLSREVVEEIAFQARQDRRIDKRSGVSQRLPISLLENVVSNAERRALLRASAAVPRITDLYAALPAITGKFELEYEGELSGADNVAREMIRSAVASAVPPGASRAPPYAPLHAAPGRPLLVRRGGRQGIVQPAGCRPYRITRSLAGRSALANHPSNTMATAVRISSRATSSAPFSSPSYSSSILPVMAGIAA